MRKTLGFIIVSVALAACSNGPPKASRAAPSPNRVTIRGTVYDNISFSCDAFRPNELAGLGVTVMDQSQTVIGTAQLGTTTTTPTSSGCVASAEYSLTVPKESFYQAKAPGVLFPVSKSFEELKSSGFAWDFGFAP